MVYIFSFSILRQILLHPKKKKTEWEQMTISKEIFWILEENTWQHVMGGRVDGGGWASISKLNKINI